ncbi:MAG: hypothetical protein M0R80_13265 [Proteobacteria bacterium]|jgi:hypothetical protein|nr:hypothetical protein [Pseudomonadota bacterium]
MRYKKKPVVVEAFQWTGDENQTEDPEWIVKAIKSGEVWFDKMCKGRIALVIYTLEGSMRAMPGDWIIKGIKGEIYPCKPDVFEETYEVIYE